MGRVEAAVDAYMLTRQIVGFDCTQESYVGRRVASRRCQESDCASWLQGPRSQSAASPTAVRCAAGRVPC